MTYENCARQLWQHGLTQVAIDQRLVDWVRDTHAAFLKKRDDVDDHQKWRDTRAGEQEVDLGLIIREGGIKDRKSFFHYDRSLDTWDVGGEFEAIEFFAAQRALYEHVCDIASALTLEMVHQHEILDWPLTRNDRDVPYGTTTLRTLHYPDAPDQKGAKAHIDRSFLTIHMGDQGGTLRALESEHDDSGGLVISPPLGMAVVFFGVKALWVTHGRQRPLWHKSVTVPGQDRFALVQFIHSRHSQQYQVRNALEACRYWDRSHS